LSENEEGEGLDMDSSPSNFDQTGKSAKRISGTNRVSVAAATASTGGSTKRRKSTKSAPYTKAAISEKTAYDKSPVSAVIVRTLTIPSLPICLPRTREMELIQQQEQQSLLNYHVMGIDEAGRGPLAGPVVAAAAIVPVDIAGIIDSKKLTNEATREELYEKIITSPRVQWAVAIVDAARIDEVNILQATLQGMRMAATALMDLALLPSEHDGFRLVQHSPPDSSIPGCYVVRSVCAGGASKNDDPVNISNKNTESPTTTAAFTSTSSCSYYALIDGNRLPNDMPCQAETMVKGDGREYCIAAASILAKVTRDRLMHQYDSLYPVYNLKQHKGYPTVFHMDAVRKHGASPIHRRSFAPLKHMVFDDNGKVVVVVRSASTTTAPALRKHEEATEKKTRVTRPKK
jgi:ribonuclease HII